MENKLEYSPQPSRSFPSKKNNNMSPKADFMVSAWTLRVKSYKRNMWRY